MAEWEMAVEMSENTCLGLRRKEHPCWSVLSIYEIGFPLHSRSDLLNLFCIPID
jgi:hypothetical protein